MATPAAIAALLLAAQPPSFALRCTIQAEGLAGGTVVELYAVDAATGRIENRSVTRDARHPATKISGVKIENDLLQFKEAAQGKTWDVVINRWLETIEYRLPGPAAPTTTAAGRCQAEALPDPARRLF